VYVFGASSTAHDDLKRVLSSYKENGGQQQLFTASEVRVRGAQGMVFSGCDNHLS